MKQEIGYYWIKIKMRPEEWIISYFCGNYYWMIGSNKPIFDQDVLLFTENKLKQPA